MLSLTIARKAYAQHLQYRSAHIMRSVASIVIGYVYACIWIGVGDSGSLGEYGLHGMISYIAFNQACLWTIYTTNSLASTPWCGPVRSRLSCCGRSPFSLT